MLNSDETQLDFVVGFAFGCVFLEMMNQFEQKELERLQDFVVLQHV